MTIGNYVFVGPGVVFTNDKYPLRRRAAYQPRGAIVEDNVSIGAKDKVKVNTYQEPYLYGGYYGYPRHGYYGSPWYGGSTRTTVHQYTEAQVYLDVVDANTHKLVWQGVATFNLTDKMQEQVRDTVFLTVGRIFEQFPVAAPSE